MTTTGRPRRLIGRIAVACLLGTIALSCAGCATNEPPPGKLRYYGGPKQPMYPENRSEANVPAAMRDRA